MDCSRGQSETVGTLLVTGLVVVVVGVGTATVVLDTDEVTEESPLVELDVDVTAQDIELTHEGGDAVTNADVEVILRAGGHTERHTLGSTNVTGDDSSFDPGDAFQKEHDVGQKTADVVVVHRPSETVLLNKPVDVGVPGEGLLPGARFEITPAHPDPDESVTFDASTADDNDGTIQTYEWDFGDGNTDSKSDPTTTHTFSNEDTYEVTLTVVDDAGLEDEVTKSIRVTPLRAPDDPGDVSSGLDYEYYEASGEYTSLPDFDAETPEKTGSVTDFDISTRDRGTDYAFRFTGYVQIPEDGEYTFYTNSDDGSELYIGDTLVVDNGGLHAPSEASGTIQLQEGKHEIRVTHFEHHGGEVLDVSWDGPTVGKERLPASRLYRKERPRASVDPTCSGLTCDFDASASTAPDGIDSYTWDFGDGNTTTTADATVSHTFGSPGEYTVVLTVNAGDGSDSVEKTVTARDLREPDAPSDVSQGIEYEYYEARGEYTSLPDFDVETPRRTGMTSQVDLSPSHRESDFAFQYTGYVEVPHNDTYTFYTDSDDGSELYIGDTLVVDNGGLHAPSEASGKIALEAGKHEIRVTHFEHHGGEVLDVRWESPNISKDEIPAANLYRANDPLASFTQTCSGLTCDFDASGTTHTGGSIAEYSWDFGDGETASESDATASHSYDSGGTYEVTLNVTGDGGQHDEVAHDVDARKPRESEGLSDSDVEAGLDYEYYEASDEYTSLSDFYGDAATRAGEADDFNISKRDSGRNTDFGFNFTGYIKVPEDGTYTFYTESDDGSELYVGDTLVVDNGGLHSARERSGTIALEAGYHPITVTMFEHTGVESLTVRWENESISKQEIPEDHLYSDSS